MTISLTASNATTQSQVASTLPHLETVIRDAVTDGTPLLSFMLGELGNAMRRGNGMDGPGLPGAIVGGRDISVPVQLLANETPGSYSGSDSLNVTHQDTDRYALYAIRQNAASINIEGREKRGNKGAPQIYNLLEGKVSRMVSDFRTDLTRQIVSDGTGNGGKDIDGLEAVISVGTLGGLAIADFPKWQPGGVPASDTIRHGIKDTVTFDQTTGFQEMTRLHNALSNGSSGDHPDIKFCAQNVHQIYENALTDSSVGTTRAVGQIQYTTFNEGGYGFEALVHKGRPLLWDWGIADGTMYYLNSSHLALMLDSEANFAWLSDDLEKPVDQDIYVRVMIVEGNVVTDNRRHLGKNTTITAS